MSLCQTLSLCYEARFSIKTLFAFILLESDNIFWEEVLSKGSMPEIEKEKKEKKREEGRKRGVDREK